MSLPEFSLQGSLFSIDAKTKGSEPKQKGDQNKRDQNKRVGPKQKGRNPNSYYG